MDNYPIGAANNPDAPYNEIPPREVDVRIEQTMVTTTRRIGGWTKSTMPPSAKSSSDVRKL